MIHHTSHKIFSNIKLLALLVLGASLVTQMFTTPASAQTALTVMPTGDSTCRQTVVGVRSFLLGQGETPEFKGYSVEPANPNLTPPVTDNTSNQCRSCWNLPELAGRMSTPSCNPGITNAVQGAAAFKPSVIYLMAGTNNFPDGRGGMTATWDWRDLLTRLHQASPKSHIIVTSILVAPATQNPYWAGSPYYQDKMAFNARIQEHLSYFRWQHRATLPSYNVNGTEYYGTTYVDAAQGFTKADLASDGVHPSQSGWEKARTRIGTQVKTVLDYIEANPTQVRR